MTNRSAGRPITPTLELNSTYAAVVFAGMPAMAATEGGVLATSYDFQNIHGIWGVVSVPSTSLSSGRSAILWRRRCCRMLPEDRGSEGSGSHNGIVPAPGSFQ